MEQKARANIIPQEHKTRSLRSLTHLLARLTFYHFSSSCCCSKLQKQDIKIHLSKEEKKVDDERREEVKKVEYLQVHCVRH